MTQLLSLIMLFVAATAFNINQGMALTPTMVLFLLIFVTSSGVIVITVDPGDPDVMSRPPRDPKIPITNRAAITYWVLYGWCSSWRHWSRSSRDPTHRASTSPVSQ